MRVREGQQRRGWAFRLGVVIVKPLLLATTSRSWRGGEHLPAFGGCLVVLNHTSHIDTMTSAHFVHEHGRRPRYLAKSNLFKNKLLAWFLTSAGQIPVERLSRNAVGAYDAAVAAVRAGDCVVVYPEGTLTRDPELWPMAGRSGAARIALETGCPVVPVGQWGAHELLPPYSLRFDLFPRKRITMLVGPPLDLSDLTASPRTPEVVQQATERIMAAITVLVEDIRGESAPPVRFDVRASGLRQIGNPNKPARRRKEHRS